MKYLYKWAFLLAALQGEAKVQIYAHYFGQPEFVKYQHLCLQKNMVDAYELTVFEDSPDAEVSRQIYEECKRYGVRYVRIPDEVFNEPKLPILSSYVGKTAPSFQCAVATQYIYDHYVVPSEDVCVILDNDIFLLSPCSIEEVLGSHAFAYVLQRRGNVSYMLPNFIILNPRIMEEKERLDFNLGTITGCPTDSGGYTHFYLRDYAAKGVVIPKHDLYRSPSPLRSRFIEVCPLLFTSAQWRSHYFVGLDKFLHLRMGSNWSNHPQYAQMKSEVEALFARLLTEP